MTSFPLKVIEPRPCIPAGRIPVIHGLAAAAARRWSVSAPVRDILVVGIVATAAYGVWRPVSLLATLALGAVLVRAVHREEVVADVLAPYVAATVGVFGPEAAETLCEELPRPTRRDRPIAWLLDAWERHLAGAGAPVDCGFGRHRLGCPHCPYTAGETDTRCWPAPFNAWLGRMRGLDLAR